MDEKNESVTYEAKFARLERILKRLDNSQTPIDELAQDVKEGTALILELNKKLNEVETQVTDAFKLLEDASQPQRAAP
jgi:exodeoxyribonuclease VII small subunit